MGQVGEGFPGEAMFELRPGGGRREEERSPFLCPGPQQSWMAWPGRLVEQDEAREAAVGHEGSFGPLGISKSGLLGVVW